MSFKIVLIIGAARSGSTLLGLQLGALPDCTFHGELNHFWDRALGNNHLCGCGLHFQDCDFWQKIKSVVPIEPKEGAGFQREMTRLLAGKYSINPLRKIRAHATLPTAGIMESIRKLYEQISRVTGAAWIIDSSKQPIYARLLIDIFGSDRVQIIHLVRDARGVAYSMAKRRLKVDTGLENIYMVQRGVASSCYDWTKVNLSAMKLHWEVKSYIRISYEGFCADPTRTIQLVDDHFLQSGEVMANVARPVLSPHTVSGNPIRVKGAEAKVKEDTEWRYHMSCRDKLVVTILSTPLRLMMLSSSGNTSSLR